MTLKIQNNDKFKEIQCLALIISLSWYENVQKVLLLEKYKFKLVIPKRRGLFVRCTYYNTHKEYNVMMMQKNETPRLFYCRMGKSLLKTAENSQFYHTTQFLCNSFSQNNLYILHYSNWVFPQIFPVDSGSSLKSTPGFSHTCLGGQFFIMNF